MTLTPGPLVHLSPEARRKALTFVAIGTVCTLAYLGLYAGLRTAMAATTANVVAQLITTLMSTAANRRFTMQVTGHHRAVRHHLEMVGVFVLGLVVNDMALDLLAQAAPGAGSVTEMVVLLVSGGVATAVKVALMARWTRPAPDGSRPAEPLAAEGPAAEGPAADGPAADGPRPSTCVPAGSGDTARRAARRSRRPSRPPAATTATAPAAATGRRARRPRGAPRPG